MCGTAEQLLQELRTARGSLVLGRAPPDEERFGRRAVSSLGQTRHLTMDTRSQTEHLPFRTRDRIVVLSVGNRANEVTNPFEL